jgi:hypothetical protein
MRKGSSCQRSSASALIWRTNRETLFPWFDQWLFNCKSHQELWTSSIHFQWRGDKKVTACQTPSQLKVDYVVRSVTRLAEDAEGVRFAKSGECHG